MTKANVRLAIVLAIAAVGCMGTANAQQANTTAAPRTLVSFPQPPNTYGTASNIVLNLGPFDFEAFGSTEVARFAQPLYISVRNPLNATFVCAELHLPNGALLESFDYDYIDTDPQANGYAELRVLNAGGQETDVAPVPFFPNVSNGNNSLHVTLQFPLLVQNSTTRYVLCVTVGEFSIGSVRLKRVGVNYRLQVSPAPLTATFADVPVGSPFHQFVEALNAAGITGGCGGGNYCPNAPITRGQMAVFLAAALGLHWPN